MRALFAGTFDPVTLGHLDLINRLAVMLETVVVAVLVNPEKHPVFTADERVEMLSEVCHPWPNVSVRAFQGLAVVAARDAGADCLVRGIRGADEYPGELRMAMANRALTGIDTLWLPASPQVSFISSSLVREIAGLGGDITTLVPAALAEQIRARLAQ